MNNQEAIKTLRELRRETNDSWYEEVYDIAISALQEQDVPDTNVGDMVSRQKAIDAINNIMPTKEGLYEPSEVLCKLMQLPSVQPELEHTMEEFMYGQDLGSPEDGSL